MNITQTCHEWFNYYKDKSKHFDGVHCKVKTVLCIYKLTKTNTQHGLDLVPYNYKNVTIIYVKCAPKSVITEKLYC